MRKIAVVMALAITISGVALLNGSSSVSADKSDMAKLVACFTDESVKLALENDPCKRAKLLVESAQARLDSLKACDGENGELAEAYANSYGKFTCAACDQIKNCVEKGSSCGPCCDPTSCDTAWKEISASIKNNQKALEEVLAKAPEKAKDTIKEVLENTKKSCDVTSDAIKKAKSKKSKLPKKG